MKELNAGKIGASILAAFLLVGLAHASFAMGEQENKKAIVLAEFGTSYPSALKAVTDIQKQVQGSFPGTKVKIAFTSNIIRDIWHKRQGDKRFLAEYKDIPKEILYVKGPLATIADLQDEGYRTIIVQPTLIYDGEEYSDLCSYIRGLNSIGTIKAKYMPFVKLVVGRPALGANGVVVHDYHKDMEIAARALLADVEIAKKNRAALVYMGHGNEFYSTGVYAEFQQVMRNMYPDTKIFIGTVEGFPSFNDVLSSVKQSGVKEVVLKPLMLVAGDHANNDMAGDEDGSWKNAFKAAGIRVKCIIKGLGENAQWAKIYVNHIMDAARDNDISL
ncbi:MAG: sirohydrochlorin cobaltochelatase [Desulfobacteraceae bacterium]|nr:sirohydrochlorin cobaltochelatase [Desulfobacteraceae bacterium]